MANAAPYNVITLICIYFFTRGGFNVRTIDNIYSENREK